MKSERLTRRVEALNKITLTPQFQQNNFDCGQTVLDMLGYKGHELFPDESMSPEMLLSLPNAKLIPIQITEEENIDYSTPKVWLFLPKGMVISSETHWVIRYGTDIYCPTLGKIPVAEYKQKYVAFVLQVYDVPVKHNLRQKHPAKKTSVPQEVTIEESPPSSISPSPVIPEPEFGSREWAEFVARTIGQYDADWWYNSPAARKEREMKEK